MLSRAHRGPNVQEQLSSWWLPASLREIWPKCPLSTLYLVPNWWVFSKFWKKNLSVFETLCLSHFYISPFFKTSCQVSSAQTIWICEQLPIHHIFWLELHIFFSLLQLSEMQYIKRNLELPNKFNLFCHSRDPSTTDQSAFSLAFPNLSPHSLENNQKKKKRTWVDVQVHTVPLSTAGLSPALTSPKTHLTYSCS